MQHTIVGIGMSAIRFRSICRRNGLPVTDEQLEQLSKFVGLLLDANRRVNLISRKDEENVWQNHILHSISPLFRLSFTQCTKFLDLGTGGGLPGIPLRILMPNSAFTLLDSIEKKTRALSDIVRELGLAEVSVVCGRAEELAKKPMFKHTFDAVVSRAVAPLRILAAWARPFVRQDPGENPDRNNTSGKRSLRPGALLAFKGGEIRKEVEETITHMKAASVQEIPLVFEGSETVSLVDKKLIIVQF